MPDYWDYNVVRVEGGDSGLGFAELAEAADGLQRALTHRKLELEDEAAGQRVRADFERAGWRAERLVWMRRSGPVEPAGADVEEVPYADTAGLRRAWYDGDEFWTGDAAAVDRFLVLEDRVAAIKGLRAVVARAGGEPAGFASWWSSGEAVEVDGAFVLPRHRDRGLGAGLVRAALAASECGEQLIVADDEGRARWLYARLGFVPAWRLHGFTRHPRTG